MVVRRHIWSGRVSNAKPLTVVEDSDRLSALHLAEGTPFKIATARAQRADHLSRLAAGTWELQDDKWTRSWVLILTRPNERYSIWAFWSATNGAFEGWYVNFEDPARRSPMGFDTRDLFLDIVVPVEGPWRWKDEDEFVEAEQLGLITPEDVREVRAAAERVLGLVESGEAWWLPWSTWTPNPEWPVPKLPPSWSVVASGSAEPA